MAPALTNRECVCRWLVVVACLLEALTGLNKAWAGADAVRREPSEVRTTPRVVTPIEATPVVPPTPIAMRPSLAVEPSRKEIGYVGCSMTMNAVSGYESQGGSRIWPVVKIGGGGIYRWARDTKNTSKYWSAFQEALDANPATVTIWWELCAMGVDGPEDSYESAVAVLKELKRRLPGAVIHVSAQPAYLHDHVCGIAGPDGPSRMKDIANALVAKGQALEGPVMGPLAESHIRPDGCHANVDGEAVMGKQLIDYFGR